MPASPFAHPLVLRPDQIVRFLRLISSPACRGEKRVPLLAIAAMCGVSRLALYRVLWTGWVSAEMAELLTQTREDDSAAELVSADSASASAR